MPQKGMEVRLLSSAQVFNINLFFPVSILAIFLLFCFTNCTLDRGYVTALMKTFKRLKSSFYYLVFATFFLVLTLFGFSEEVFASTVTLSPTSGVAGQVVIITGSAFDNSSAATITWDGAALTTTPSSVTTSASGAIPASGTVSFVVPSSSYGAHTVQITTGSTNIGVATFTVNTPAIAISSPTVPTAGLPPGVTLTVTATNLEASQTTTFYFDDTSMGTSTSSVNGTAELVFAIPDVNNTGAHVIRASNSAYAVASMTMTVATPAITLTPSTSAVGTQINVLGTNFKAGAAVTFYFNGTSLSMGSLVTANGAGSFANTFTVPTAAAGANTVKAQSYANLFAAATLTVSTPAITVTPTSGAGGLSVTVSGTGFKASSTVNFYVNGSSISTTATTNSLGAFQAAINMPSSAPSGAQTIRAQTDDVNFATGTYTITAAAVTASPTTGAPGTKVTLVGTNFDPSTKVVIKWNGTVIKPAETDLTTSTMGAFQGNITIPADYVSGNGQIEVSTSSNSTVLVTFTIANPTLTLSATSGLPGAKITVTGANYEGNKTLKLTWDDGAIVTTPSKIVTTPLGSFFAVITVPNSSRGTHYISASAGTSTINGSTTFTVTAPALTLSTTTGQSSNKVTVSGTGFKPNEEVSFGWDNNPNIEVENGPITTDASGYFSANFTVPKVSGAGIHIFSAKTGDNVFATSNFTVTTGTLSLSKSNGGPLSKIQLTGTSFDANNLVTVYWDGNLLGTDKTITDGIGNFIVDMKVPLSSPGVHTIKAITGEFNSAVVDFTIDTPTLTISPAGARSGSIVTIQGAGFVANSTVNLLVNKRKITSSPEKIVSDGNGNFTATITVPNTFGDSLTIAASTGDLDFASVDYPITHSAFFKASVATGNYSLMGLFFVFGFLLLRFAYFTYKDPVKRAEFVRKVKHLSDKWIEKLRERLAYFMKLSNTQKVIVILMFIITLLPNIYKFLRRRFYKFLKIEEKIVDKEKEIAEKVLTEVEGETRTDRNGYHRWVSVAGVIILIGLLGVGVFGLYVIRSQKVQRVNAQSGEITAESR